MAASLIGAWRLFGTQWLDSCCVQQHLPSFANFRRFWNGSAELAGALAVSCPKLDPSCSLHEDTSLPSSPCVSVLAGPAPSWAIAVLHVYAFGHMGSNRASHLHIVMQTCHVWCCQACLSCFCLHGVCIVLQMALAVNA